MIKTCSKCLIEKSEKDFYKNKLGKNGLQSYCKDCNKLKCKGWEKSNYPKRLEYNIRNTYGLSLEEYEQLLIKHNYSCAICKRNNCRLCIDHCHKTNLIRGILCSRCNTHLSLLDDFREQALNYLDEFKTKPPQG